MPVLPRRDGGNSFRHRGVSRSSPHRSNRQHALLLEQLETRSLLAYSLEWDGWQGAMRITGGPASDAIQLQPSDESPPRLLINGSSQLLVHGQPISILAAEVRSIHVSGGGGADHLDLSGVHPIDFPSLGDGMVTILGDAGRDMILGSAFGDLIHGGLGNDTLFGGAGDDGIDGDDGVDTLHGGLGADALDVGRLGSDTNVEPRFVAIIETPEAGRPSILHVRIPEDQTKRGATVQLVLRDVHGAPLDPRHAIRMTDAETSIMRWDLSGVAEFNAASLIGFTTTTTDAVEFPLEPPRDGDLNLDGAVSSDEVRRMIASLGQSPATWTSGDMDHDGEITPLDALRGLNELSGVLERNAKGAESMSGDGGDDRFVILEPKAQQTIRIDDSEGIDLLDFSRWTSGVGLGDFDLSAALSHLQGSGTADRTTLRFSSAPDIEDVQGTPFPDRIRGTDAANTLRGGGGDDRLWGVAGPDQLLGERGDDLLYAEEGQDHLEGGEGNDDYVFGPNASFITLDESGGGVDRLDFATYSEGISVDLDRATVAESRAGGGLRVLVTQGAIEDVRGTPWDDWIRGNAAANRLEGMGGNDILMSFGGPDRLEGGTGADALEPGEEADFMDPGSGFDDPEIVDQVSTIGGAFQPHDDPAAVNQAGYVASSATGFPPSAVDLVRWTSDVVEPGSYEVFATWTPRATAATNGTWVAPGHWSRQMDQRTVPVGKHRTGHTWQSLGVVEVATPQSVIVELRAASADGDLIADAVRIERVGAAPRWQTVSPVTLEVEESLSLAVRIDYPEGDPGDVEMRLADDTPPGVFLRSTSATPDMAHLEWPFTAAREAGAYPITVIAQDRNHPTRIDETTVWVTLGAANVPPVLELPSLLRVRSGEILQTTIGATDPDGPELDLRYALPGNAPVGVSLHPLLGQLTWDTFGIAAGIHTISVEVADRGHPQGITRGEVVVEVTPTAIPLGLRTPGPQTLLEDGSLEFSVSQGNPIELDGPDSTIATLAIVVERGQVHLSPAANLTYLEGSVTGAERLVVRGRMSDIRMSLSRIVFVPPLHDRGPATLRLELRREPDPSVAVEEHLVRTIAVNVLPVIDAPALQPQVLHFRPSDLPGDLQLVGRVVATDPDPDQWLALRITSGNADGAFTIDAGTGRIVARDNQVLPSGERLLEVEAYYEASPTHQSTATITVRRVPDANFDPLVGGDIYEFGEDEIVVGNLISGDLFGGVADLDGDGDLLKLVAAEDSRGQGIPVGQTRRLPTGIEVTVEADGYVRIDPSSSRRLDEEYFGATQEWFRYTVEDAHGARSSGTVDLAIQHVNDPLRVIPRTFAVDPDSTAGSQVGRILTENREPTEPITLRIVAGDPEGKFGLDADGTLLALAPTSFEVNETYDLVVEATGADGISDEALIQVRIEPTHPPAIAAISTSIAADLPLVGDLIASLGGTQGGGGAWRVAEVDGQVALVNGWFTLPSGVEVRIDENGEYRFDPSSSSLYRRLAEGASRLASIPVTIEDAAGNLIASEVLIQVLGRNQSPSAGEDMYQLADDAIHQGNLIHDRGPLGGQDSDPNLDRLGVVRVNGEWIGDGLTFMTRRGALARVTPSGSFTYDPGGLPWGDLPAGSRLSDAFTYQIADGKGGYSTALARFEITRSDADLRPLRIQDLRLVQDTAVDGGSPTDGMTLDPRIQGSVRGTITGTQSYVVEFALNAAGSNGLPLPADELLSDTSLTLNANGANPLSFQLNPEGLSPFGGHGAKTVAVRVQAYDSQQVLLETSAWTYISFTWLQALDQGPIRVTAIDLLQDTMRIGADGSLTGHDDRQTTDPRIAAQIGGTFQNPPLAIGDRRFVRIEFEHTRDGQTYAGAVEADAAGTVLYDPRDADSELSTALVGDLSVSYIATRVERIGGVTSQSWLASGSVDFHFLAIPASCAEIMLQEGPPDTSGYLGDSRRIEGTIARGSGCETEGGQATVEFDHAGPSGAFDSLPDGAVGIFSDATQPPGLSAPTFQYTAQGLSGAIPQIRARFKEWNQEFGEFQFGLWSPPLVLSPPTIPAIAAMSSPTELMDGREVPWIQGYLAGSEDDPGADPAANPAQLASVRVIFYHRPEGDISFSPGWTPDGDTYTDVQGRFSYHPHGLPYNQDLRLWAHTERTLGDGTVLRGEPREVHPVRLASPVLPEIQTFALFDPSAGQLDGGYWRTSDIRMSVQARRASQGGIEPSLARLEFSHDRPGVVGDEAFIAGTATIDASGLARYAPPLTPGEVTIRVRVLYYDAIGETHVRGAWSDVELPLRVEAETNQFATVERLRLANPIQPTSDPPHTREPRVTGEIHNPDGYVAYTPVEFREVASGLSLGTTLTDRNGVFTHALDPLSSGTRRIEARTYDWDYVHRSWIPGPWSPTEKQLTFVLDAVGPTEVVSLGLLSDTGPVPLTTANPALLGRVDGGNRSEGVTVALDHGDDGSIEHYVTTDSQGFFTHFPEALGFGPHLFRARVATWNLGSGYTYSAGRTLAFTLEQQANSPATIVSVGLAHPAVGGEPVRDAMLIGRIANEQLLADVVIEIDDDANDANGINGTATTDRLGQFQFAPRNLPRGTTTLRVRTKELDPASAQYLVGVWSTLPSFNFQPLETFGPTLSLALVQSGVGNPPQVSDASVSGSVSAAAVPSRVRVEFSLEQHGTVVGTAQVEPSGSFSFTPAGLQEGTTYTLWARGRESLPNSDHFLFGPPVSVTFRYQSSANQGPRVSEFRLLQDTAMGGGSTSTDGSTRDARLVGTVVASSGSVQGIVVEIDRDRDGQADHTVTTDAAGRFDYDPMLVDRGFYSFRARVASGSGSTSPYRTVNFVYDTDESSPSALALVEALEVLDPAWQHADDLDFSAAQDLADAIAHSASTGADADFQFAVTRAREIREAIEADVERDYADARAVAEQALETSLVHARQSFLLGLAALPVEQRATYALTPFLWPEAPFANGLAIPADTSQPRPPGVPTYSGPDFDPARDPQYRGAEWDAEQAYQSALSDAQALRLEESRALRDEETDELRELEDRYALRDRELAAAYETALEDSPLLEDGEYLSTIAAIQAAWLDYSRATQALWNEDVTRRDAALARRTTRTEDAYIPFHAAGAAAANAFYGGDYPHDLTTTKWNNYLSAIYAADNRLLPRLQEIEGEYERALAEVKRDLGRGLAEALHTARSVVYPLQRTLAEIVRRYEHDSFVDSQRDQWLYQSGRGLLIRDKSKDLAELTSRYEHERAEVEYRYAERLATAKRDRDLATNQARLVATQHWSVSVGSIWSSHRAAVSQIDATFTAARVALEFAKARGLAGALRFQANILADANRARSDALAEAELARTTALGEEELSHRILVSEEFLIQDLAISGFGFDLRTDSAASDYTESTEVATAIGERDSALANAREANIQPGNLMRAICTATFPCAGSTAVFAFVVAIDNSSIRARNQARYELARDDAELAYSLDGSDILEVAQAERIEARRVFRVDANEQIRDTTVALSHEAASHQIIIARSQDDYQLAVTQAAAGHAAGVSRAEARRHERELLAAEFFRRDVAASQHVRDVEIAQSTQAYELAEASAFVLDVQTWAGPIPTPWGTYQIALANAEHQRVTAVNAANVVRSDRGGRVLKARIAGEVVAEEVYAAAVYGTDGALVRRAERIAQGHIDLAEDRNFEDFVRPPAEAIRDHDEGVADETLTYRLEVVAGEAARDLELGNVAADRDRANARILYATRRNPTETDGVALSRAALETYFQAASGINVALILRRESARKAWKEAVGELHVQQVHNLVDFQLANAETRNREPFILAQRLEQAIKEFAFADGTASRTRDLLRVRAAGTESIQHADLAAWHADAMLTANQDLQTAQATARDDYERALHAAHRGALQAIAGNHPSPLARYQAALAIAAATRAETLADAAAETRAVTFAAEDLQRARINDAERGQARQLAAIRYALAEQQTAAELTLRGALTATLATTHLRSEEAKADLRVANQAARAAADIASAEAARTRDDAFSAAYLTFVETIAAAHADWFATCGTAYWNWGVLCGSETGDFDEETAAALERRELAERAAQDTFDRAIRDLRVDQTLRLTPHRMTYADKLASAKQFEVESRAAALETLTRSLAVARTTSTLRETTAQRSADLAVETAEFQFLAAAGSARLDALALERDVDVTNAVAQGNAETRYQIERSAEITADWNSVSAAYPGDLYFAFRAAEAESRAIWFETLASTIPEYRGAISAADGAQRVATATARHQRELATRQALLNDEAKQGELEAARVATFASIQQADDLANVLGQNRLAIELAAVDRRHALAAAQAEINHDEAVVRINHQFEQDQDADARDSALITAERHRAIDRAAANAHWRRDTAEQEHDFQRTESQRETLRTQAAARAARARQNDLAEAATIQEDARAAADAAVWRAEAEAQHNAQADRTLAEANLRSATSAAQTLATARLAQRLASPWAQFVHVESVAWQEAWNAIRPAFLASDQVRRFNEQVFTDLRVTAYIQQAQAIAWAEQRHREDLARTTEQSMFRGAEAQRTFAAAHGERTRTYRGDVALAEWTFDVAKAVAAGVGGDLSNALAIRQAALDAAADQYRHEYVTLNRRRRDGLGEAGFSLAAESQALGVERSARVVAAQEEFQEALRTAYFDADPQRGLEASRADLEQAYLLTEAAAVRSRLATLATNPWSMLALATATSRESYLVQPLAALRQSQRLSLADARNAFEDAQGHALRTRATAETARDAIVAQTVAAGQLARLSIAQAPNVPTPLDVDPGSPDMGQVSLNDTYIGVSYPGVADIDVYGHPGSYAPWGEGYWGSPDFFTNNFLWTGVGWNTYGWPSTNYLGTFGFGTPTYGYAGYVPWSFVWNGWTGTSLLPPTGVSTDFRVNVPDRLVDFRELAEQLTTPGQERLAAFTAAEDPYVPVLDPMAGQIAIGDTAAAFQVANVPPALAAAALDRFTSEPGPQAERTSDRSLNSLTAPLATSTPTVTTEIPSTTPSDTTSEYDFDIRFKISVEGSGVFISEGALTGHYDTSFVTPSGVFASMGTHDIVAFGPERYLGFLDSLGWVHFGHDYGYGRATLDSLRLAASRWNQAEMRSVLSGIEAVGGQVNRATPQVQQLVDGVRSPFQIQEDSSSIGIFLGGTDMHFYGVGNVEKMYNLYRGTKFYYGGVGNRVDSNHPDIEGGTAFTEFNEILRRAQADVRTFGVGKQVHIFGWSRGAAQAAELARALGALDIPVAFVGMFDPVYSYVLPGQQSLLVEASPEGHEGNFVTATISANVERAVAIYAMNEIRTWFPATIFNTTPGSSTQLLRVASPGAHGEIGGHWESNLAVQRLNLHQMIARVENNATYFNLQSDGGKDAEITGIYASVYTTYLALRDQVVPEFDLGLQLTQFQDSQKDVNWRNPTGNEFIVLANDHQAKSWSPSPLSAQTSTMISSLTVLNSASIIQKVGESIVFIPTFGQVTELLPRSRFGSQPALDYAKRTIARFMDADLGDLYPGIDRHFIQDIMSRTMNPYSGGWIG